MLSNILISLCLLFPPAVRAAEKEDFIIYEAQSRPAEELKSAAATVMNGARISVLNSKVVIYGTKRQRDAVLKLFSELDHQLRNFSVSLRIAARGNSARASAAVEANVADKNLIVGKKSGVLQRKGGGTLGYQDEAGSVTASAESVNGESGARDGQQITVSEGGTARLYADSGIFPKTVTLHLRAIGKSGAHVEIRETDSNSVGEQAIVTDLDVPLGEWRTIGGITNSSSGRNGELLGHAKRSSMSSQDVQVKVELAGE